VDAGFRASQKISAGLEGLLRESPPPPHFGIND
jgi:hypothetical protein